MARGRRDVDELLIATLACGATAEIAAQKVGISRATVQRRLKNPAFCARLQQVRSEMVSRTAGMLTASGGEAVKTLVELLKSTVPHATRLGAARTILELGPKAREASDLEQRLLAVEQQLAASQQ